MSSIAQGGAILTYTATRPEPTPTLTIRIDGEGEGQVLVTRVGDSAPLLRCAKARCSVEVEPGTRLRLSAVLGEKATFGGYHQYPMRTPAELVSLIGDPLAACVGGDAVTAAANGDVLQCPITIAGDTDVAVEFGAQPDEVEVRMEPPTVAATEPDAIKPVVPPLAPIEAEKLDAPIVALVPPEEMKKLQPPPQLKPPPPPELAAEKPKTPPPPPPPNMVMVEVKDDKHVVEQAPDDATKLSDKNRNVDEETRAKETNLDKESDGQTVASRESDDKSSKEVGGPDDKIRQNEETKPTTDDRIEESDHSGKDEVAKGVIKGEEGDKGEEGKGEKEPGLLAMRGIAGRGSVVDQSKDGKAVGKKGLPGVNTPMQQTDYERLMGKDKVEEERQIAARRMGSRKGRWEKKLDSIKSSLENFTPDVRPGNQTALKTRAHPYAIYIARMHRHIHEAWGFGFLEDLDNRPADDALNNPDLWVNLEVSVNPDGTLHKVTIAKTSGKTEFDVAAVDTVISSGPYEETPEAIRSVDGRIYLRWGFYRNWRQCGTFNVEPYILTSVPEGNDVGALDGPDGNKPGKQPRITPKHHPIGEGVVTPDDGHGKDSVSPASSVTDKQAVFAANLWITGFATASIEKLMKMSTTPFYAGGKVAAETPADLKEMYGNLVVESGAMKEWKLLKPSEYAGTKLPEGNVIVSVQATNASFAVVLTRTPSGEYRATQLAR
ncbi:MAG: hypothetical protein NT062_10200 [Proteobacteria bacterium]|nr:hypothetical protein [Pseudomonadota bacterium]